MARVLAFEPDGRQAAALTRVVQDRVGAELVLAESKDAALAAIRERVPDLILVTPLISPRDETEIADLIREIEGAEHTQTLTIPMLDLGASQPEKKKRKKRGLLSALTGDDVAPAATNGCDPAVFADEIKNYLQQAVQMRAEAAESREQGAKRPKRRKKDASTAATGEAGTAPPGTGSYWSWDGPGTGQAAGLRPSASALRTAADEPPPVHLEQAPDPGPSISAPRATVEEPTSPAATEPASAAPVSPGSWDNPWDTAPSIWKPAAESTNTYLDDHIIPAELPAPPAADLVEALFVQPATPSAAEQLAGTAVLRADFLASDPAPAASAEIRPVQPSPELRAFEGQATAVIEEPENEVAAPVHFEPEIVPMRLPTRAESATLLALQADVARLRHQRESTDATLVAAKAAQERATRSAADTAERAKREAERRAEEAAARARQEAETERKAREAAEKRAQEEAERRAQAEKRAAEEAERREKEAEERARRRAEEQAKVRADTERKDRELAERQAREETERRIDAERQKAREEAERRAREDAEQRLAAERQRAQEEAERLAREQAERRLEKERQRAREDAERQARAEAEQRIEQERKAREEAERRAAAEKLAREQAERRAREETARLEREARERQAHAQAERRAREAAEAHAAAERKAREQSERRARDEAERRAREAERRAQQEEEARARKAAEAERLNREAEARARQEAETERRARQQAEQRAAQAEKRAREEAERRAQAERRAGEAAERKAREDAERAAREAAERQAREEAEGAAREKGAEAGTRKVPARKGRKTRTAPPKKNGKPAGGPVQDEWGLYDPNAAGFEALFARLESIEKGEIERPRAKTLPSPKPLSMWAIRFDAQGDAATPAPKRRDEFRALVSQFSIPHAVAAVSYARGARVRKVRVRAVGRKHAASATDPRVVILSRKLLKEARRQRQKAA